MTLEQRGKLNLVNSVPRPPSPYFLPSSGISCELLACGIEREDFESALVGRLLILRFGRVGSAYCICHHISDSGFSLRELSDGMERYREREGCEKGCHRDVISFSTWLAEG